jgi:hypothetical protein
MKAFSKEIWDKKEDPGKKPVKNLGPYRKRRRIENE